MVGHDKLLTRLALVRPLLAIICPNNEGLPLGVGECGARTTDFGRRVPHARLSMMAML